MSIEYNYVFKLEETDIATAEKRKIKRSYSTADKKRVSQIVESILKTPFEGIGKPEPLKGDFRGYWSRRLKAKDRIIYKVEGDKVIVFHYLAHYKQK